MTPPNLDWESTMTPSEVLWCYSRINERIYNDGDDFGGCVDSLRAARAWKRTQVKRFKKLRSCCGSCEWIEKKWSWKKFKFERYLLGFNFGH
jgi:hypothetical protein